MRRKHILIWDFFMEIRKTRNRFLSILLIVLLGTAFYAGVRAASPDMKLSADEYYDQNHLMDIQVFSTLGLTDEDVEKIQQIEGVKHAEGAYSMDILADQGEEELALKLLTFSDQMNIPTVEEGRLPERKGEIFVDSLFMQNQGYEIGDVLHMKSGTDEKIEEILSTDDFTIVGYGKSPLYLSLENDSTTIGNGTLNGFALVTTDSFALEAYTQIYVEAEDVMGLNCFETDYQDQIDEVQERIEEISGLQCQNRYEEIYEEGRRQIEDGEKEISDAKAELEDARKELSDGQQKISEAKNEIADGEAELSDGAAKIQAAKQEISDGKKQIQSAEEQLQSAKQKIQSGQAELAQAWNELTGKQQTLDTGMQQYQESYKQWETGNQELANAKAEIQKLREQLQEQSEYIEELRKQENLTEEEKQQIAAYDQAVSEVSQQEIACEQQEQILTESREKIDSTKKQLDQGYVELESGRKILESKQKELEAAQTEVSSNESLLNRKKQEMKSGEQDLLQAQQDYDEGVRELEDGKSELLKKEQELQDAQKEFDDKEPEANQKIADAEAEIADAKKQLEELEKPEWFVMDRSSIRSYVEYGQDSDRIKAIGQVFPVIFFLVAALICLTTMTRMVEENRTQIGTLKALGYSKRAISAKYLGYAFLATFIGSGIGLILGQKILPIIIIDAYKILYVNLPVAKNPLHINYSITAMAAGIASTMIATLFACAKELSSVPAELMRPASPVNGKRIALERITFIWKRMNFTEKSTMRNLFRYKKRFFMTVLGIGGCMGLLLTGFGLKDSIMAIGEIQFGQIQVYSGTLLLEDDLDSEVKENLENKLSGDSDVREWMYADETSITIGVDGKESRDSYLMIPQDPGKMESFVQFRDRKTKESFELSDQGIILTEKMSALLDVQEGDTVYLENEDKERVEVVIDHIVENYFYHYVYMTPSLYQSLYGEEPVYHEILTLNTDTDIASEEDFKNEYMQEDGVSSISFTSSVADRVANMLKSMDTVIYVIVISAGMLAFVVLYNLNNINISERRRELATLKVLGFYESEVGMYVFRENIWLTLFGSLIGIVFGILLHRFVIRTVEIDIMMFGRNIKKISYLYSILLTVFFSALVNVAMYFKLKKIDMVESLKSVE